MAYLSRATAAHTATSVGKWGGVQNSDPCTVLRLARTIHAAPPF